MQQSSFSPRIDEDLLGRFDEKILSRTPHTVVGEDAGVVANPTPWNVFVLLLGDTALILRALMEERVLSADVEYQQYCRRVGWHLVPGVF